MNRSRLSRSKPGFPWPLLLLAVGLGWAGGCATQPVAPAPLSAESGAAEFAARSLSDAGLHRFLADNLGRDPGGAWDFETLSWVAFYYHPSLGLARAQWATARATQQTVTARPNPTISLTPGYSTNPDAGVSPWFPAVNFDFLLPNSGKRAHQADIARADAEAARLAVLTAAWQVRSDLRRALVDAGSAARRESLLREQAAVQLRLLTLAEQRLAAGAAASSEVAAMRSASFKSEAAALDAHSQAALARARVAAAAGLPLAALEGVALPVPAAAPALSAEAFAAARQTSLQTRADVLAALAHYASAQAALELEVAKQQPDIHLGPGYQWDQGQNKWSVALTFELPIFHRNEGPIAEMTSRRAEAAAQFTAAQAQAIAAIDAATLAQSAAAVQLGHARRQQEIAGQQNARAAARLAAGESEQSEVQNARLAVAEAGLAVADAESAAALAAGELEDALQIPFANLAALTPAPAAPATSPRSP